MEHVFLIKTFHEWESSVWENRKIERWCNRQEMQQQIAPLELQNIGKTWRIAWYYHVSWCCSSKKHIWWRWGDDLFLSLTLSGRVLKWLELQFLEPQYSSVNTSPAGGICDESAAILLGIHMACCWSSSSFWSFPSKLIIVSLPKEKMLCGSFEDASPVHPWLYAADLEDGLKWIHTSKEVDAYPSSASHLPSCQMKEMWIWASPHPRLGVQSLDHVKERKACSRFILCSNPNRFNSWWV